jgi:hypothetical protein
MREKQVIVVDGGPTQSGGLIEKLARIAQPLRAAQTQQTIGHPIAGGGWVEHPIAVEPPLIQGPPSRQQLRAWKRREEWNGLKGVKMPRKERRKLLREHLHERGEL